MRLSASPAMPRVSVNIATHEISRIAVTEAQGSGARTAERNNARRQPKRSFGVSSFYVTLANEPSKSTHPFSVLRINFDMTAFFYWNQNKII
jgi:hypothetical protein